MSGIRSNSSNINKKSVQKHWSSSLFINKWFVGSFFVSCEWAFEEEEEEATIGGRAECLTWNNDCVSRSRWTKLANFKYGNAQRWSWRLWWRWSDADRNFTVHVQTDSHSFIFPCRVSGKQIGELKTTLLDAYILLQLIYNCDRQIKLLPYYIERSVIDDHENANEEIIIT